MGVLVYSTMVVVCVHEGTLSDRIREDQMLVTFLVLVRVTGSCPDSGDWRGIGNRSGWCGWEE